MANVRERLARAQKQAELNDSMNRNQAVRSTPSAPARERKAASTAGSSDTRQRLALAQQEAERRDAAQPTPAKKATSGPLSQALGEARRQIDKRAEVSDLQAEVRQARGGRAVDPQEDGRRAYEATSAKLSHLVDQREKARADAATAGGTWDVAPKANEDLMRLAQERVDLLDRQIGTVAPQKEKAKEWMEGRTRAEKEIARDAARTAYHQAEEALAAAREEAGRRTGNYDMVDADPAVEEARVVYEQARARLAQAEDDVNDFGNRVGRGVQSIITGAVGSVPMLADSLGQYFANSEATDRDPAYQAQAGKVEEARTALNAAYAEAARRAGYGSRLTPAQREALRSDPAVAAALEAYEAERAKLQDARISDPVPEDKFSMRMMGLSQEAAGKALEDVEGPDRFLGETALSIGQNALYLPLAAVNPALPLVGMGANAAGSRTYELLQQGVDPGEAFTRGLVSGGIEVVTEKIPLDNLLDIFQHGGKGAVRNLLKQVGIEATEEGISYVMNYAADKAAKDPNATFSLEEMLEQAAAGGLSGLFFGGVGTAFNAVDQRRAGSVDTPTALVTQGPTAPADPVRELAMETAARDMGMEAERRGPAVAPENRGAAAQGAPRATSAETGEAQRMVDTIASTLGQSGGEAMTRAFGKAETSQRMDPLAFSRAFSTAYWTGFDGKSLQGDAAVTVSKLPSEIRLQAMEAGRADKARAVQAHYFGENAGLDRTTPEYREVKVSPKAEKTLDAMGKTFGVKIRFAHLDSDVNAMYQNGELVISTQAEDPVLACATHEALHRIRETAPEVYQEMAALVLSEMSQEKLDQAWRVRTDAYRSEDVNTVSEELVADAFGVVLGDERLSAVFAQKNPTLWERVKEFFRELLGKVKTVLGKKELGLTPAQKAQFADLEGRYADMVSLMEKAAAQVKQRGAAEGSSTGQTGEAAKYSLKKFQDGRKYADIDVDQQLFDGLTVKEAAKTARRVILERFRGKVIGTDYRAYVNRDSAEEYTHSANRRQSDAVKQAKMRASTELDTLMEASVFRENVPDDGRHPEATGGWDKLDTLFSVGGRMFSGEVSVMVTKRGKVFYDMTKIKDITSRTSGRTPEIGAPASRSDVSMDSIPETGEDVNGKNSKKYREILDRAIEEYGEMAPGEKPVRVVRLPKQTAQGRKVSQTVRTAMEAGATPEDFLPTVEEAIARGDFSHEVYGDKAAIDKARKRIEADGWGKAYGTWAEEMKSGRVSKDNVTLGWTLYNNAVNSGETKDALFILETIARHQTNAAQALQATRILKTLSPETQLYAVQRSVRSLQDELNEKYGEEKGPKLKIDDELADRLLQAKDQEARDGVLRDIYRDIGRQLPSRFLDKWNAWRYLAMLGNPRTHVRNIVGNAGFAPVVAVKDLTATAIESAVSRVSGGRLERSKAMVGLGKGDRGLLKAAWGDYAKVADTAMGESKYGDLANANKYVEEGRVIFKSKLMTLVEKGRKLNSKALDVEDVWFSKPHYAYALAQYCKANGITAEDLQKGGSRIDKARKYAIQEAQKATYRDTNSFSALASEVGRGWRKSRSGVKRFGGTVIEGILPFRKTPANILVRGVEYSPLGLMYGVKQAVFDVHKGKVTGAEAIDRISAGLTGTGLMALGVFLAAQGLVRGHGGDDDKEIQFEELQGAQAYSWVNPDGSNFTLDWLAPEALPFFVGVNLWEQTQGAGEEMSLSAALNAVGTVTEPLLEMSCLQSLNDVFDAVGYAKSDGLDALPAVTATAITSYLTQGLPTLFGQMERTGEDRRYSTFTQKNSFLTDDMQYTLGRASARIPFWDFQQIPYIDAWGREEETGAVGERAFNNFLNPAYTSEVDSSPMEEELLRLYQATGEGGVLPSRAGKSFEVNGETKYLTAEEYVKYAKAKGGTARKLLEAAVKSPIYQKLSDPDRAAAVKEVYTYANQTAKAAVSDYSPESWVTKAQRAQKETGLSPEVYLLAKVKANDVGSLKDVSGETIDNSHGLLIMEAIYELPGLNDQQRATLFEDLGVGKSVRHYNKAAVKEHLERMRRQAKG